MPFLSVMHLRVRSARYPIPFMICALMPLGQARHSRSNLGVKLLRDANRAFWILTARQKVRESALAHDGGFPSAGHAQAVGPVR